MNIDLHAQNIDGHALIVYSLHLLHVGTVVLSDLVCTVGMLETLRVLDQNLMILVIVRRCLDTSLRF